jgi:hypothetical protein
MPRPGAKPSPRHTRENASSCPPEGSRCDPTTLTMSSVRTAPSRTSPASARTASPMPCSSSSRGPMARATRRSSTSAHWPIGRATSSSLTRAMESSGWVLAPRSRIWSSSWASPHGTSTSSRTPPPRMRDRWSSAWCVTPTATWPAHWMRHGSRTALTPTAWRSRTTPWRTNSHTCEWSRTRSRSRRCGMRWRRPRWASRRSSPTSPARWPRDAVSVGSKAFSDSMPGTRGTASATTRSAPAATTPTPCTGSRTLATSGTATCCCSTPASRSTASTPPTSRGPFRSTGPSPMPNARSTTRCMPRSRPELPP